MNRRIVRALSGVVIFALAACSGSSVTRSFFPQGASPVAQSALPPDALAGPASGEVPFVGVNPVRRLCPTSGDPERMQCSGLVRTDVRPDVNLGAATSVQPGEVQSCQSIFRVGYCPIDLQHAYHLPSLTEGINKTVSIVDAYGYKRAAADLAEYRKVMGLKACSTETKCLRIVNQNGDPSPLPPESPPSNDWKGEQSLDLDMVSAICPNCKIILVQTLTNYTSSLYFGVKTAGRIGAHYIGASWGGSEGSPNSIFHQPGVVISAAAGDNGGGGDYGGSRGGPEQPCSFTYVVCVGGTHLVRNRTARGWSEGVWNDLTYDQCGFGSSPCGATGSGCSTRIAKPGWQHDIGCRMRSEADISANASLRTPVIVYNSEEGPGPCPENCFLLFGGTSASTQIISGVFALAGNSGTQVGASGIWKRHLGNVYDVTMGNNLDPHLGVLCDSPVKYICTARVGFDGPTGWGTPKGIGAF